MEPCLTGRPLHEHIRCQIELALGRRSWAWLAETSGVPQSTLSNQTSRPRFSIDVLMRVSAALDRPPSFFLPDAGSPAASYDDRAAETLQALERLVDEARQSLGCATRMNREHDGAA